MSSLADESFRRQRMAFAGALVRRRDIWLSLVLVIIVAALTRHVVVANTDVSVLLTLGEKVLDGQRPYVDFIEVNPPASIYLYLPGVMIARAIGLSPELVTNCLVFVAICASLWISGRTLHAAGLLEGRSNAKLLALVAVILAILPAQAFGEREHIAVIFFLPALAVMAVRARGGSLGFWPVLCAGLGAGIMMVIKPHFVLGFVPALVVAAYPARSRAVLLAPENWIAFAVVAAYGAIVCIAFPQFLTDTVPLARALYIPLRPIPGLMIESPAFPIWALTLVAIALLRRGRPSNCVYRILLAGSVGFAGAFLVQGKGWPYHAYPMLALALFALALALAELQAEAPKRIELSGWALAVGFIAAMTFCWMNFATTLASLVVPIRQIKAHPTMLAMTHDPSIGHPLVREVGGTWVGRVPALWITAAAMWRQSREKLTPEESARIERYVALDRSLLVDALRRAKPDLIVIQKVPAYWEAWARADHEIADLLKPYSEVLTTDDVLVLKRDGS
jgi:hypothetical protein